MDRREGDRATDRQPSHRLTQPHPAIADRLTQCEVGFLWPAPASETPVDREGLRVRLVNQKLEKMADQYLARLKADAIIRTP